MTRPDAFDTRWDDLVLHVTPDNVMSLYKLLYSEVQRLGLDLDANRQEASTMPRLGGDPVSEQASLAFDQRLAGLTVQFKNFIEDVQETATKLAETARAYGVTEEEIRSAVQSIDDSIAPAPFAAPPPATTTPQPADRSYLDHVLNPQIQSGMVRP